MDIKKFLSMLRAKKGQVFAQVSSLGVGIAALSITLVVVFLILSNTAANTAVAADGNATLAVSTLTGAAAQIPTWVPLIVIAVVGAILISLVSLFRVR